MSANYFKMPSSTHIVETNGNNFTISPVSNSETDINNFQAVARRAKDYIGKDYEIKAHETSEFGFNLIDRVVFISSESI